MVHTPDTRTYALLNDGDQRIPENVIEAMRNYEVRPIPWSGRDEVREELAA